MAAPPTVLNRLHALFHADVDGAHAHANSVPPELPRSISEPAHHVEPERTGIKVLVVTWNMGDALPKGDLSVLVGEVPAYVPAPTPSPGIPPLLVEHRHPYHIVVFAAQECPTPSGVPRGLGGGLMKGVGLKNEERKEREKEKEKERAKEEKDREERERENERKRERLREDRERERREERARVEQNEGRAPAPVPPQDAQPRVHLQDGPAAGPRDAVTSDTDDAPPALPAKDRALLPPRTSSRPTTPSHSPAHSQSVSLPRAPSPLAPGSRASHAHSQSQPPLPSQLHPLPHVPLAAPPQPHLPPPGIPGLQTPVDDEGRHFWSHSPQPISAQSSRGHSPAPDDRDRDHRDHHRSGLSSPVTPHTPMHRPGAKGWSTMLDEWLCGPTPGVRNDSPYPGSPTESPFVGFAPATLQVPVPSSRPADLARSYSAPISPTVTQPMAIPTPAASNTLPPHGNGHGMHVRSPLARSHSSHSSSEDRNRPLHANGNGHAGRHDADSYTPSVQLATSVASSSKPVPPHTPVTNGYLAPPHMDESGMARSASVGHRPDRPEIVVADQVAVSGQGPYVHVAKERLLGMYLSVYVYKGCEHLIKGVDQDFVTAGLAGGRVGNKGGVAVSLNLADHRFLFVNAHLAAHAERNDTRLANIAKIKAELKVDCFLPKDEPRANLEDITDRFDTTFWCGDLNFRVDISLLHAKWLLEQKKYRDALMFDQLRKAMADPATNPLPGFHEADIDFMPTFKYDVWKSVKATNRHLRRSLRRRKTLERQERPSPETPGTVPLPNNLSHVPEADGEANADSSSDVAEPERGQLTARADTGDDDYPDRRSLDSSVYTYGGHSVNGHDDDDVDDDDDYDDNDLSASWTRHNARQGVHAAAHEIKEKGKHFLGLLKMDRIAGAGPGTGGLGHSPRARRVTRHVSRKSLQTPGAAAREPDRESRRTSMSSFRSLRDDEARSDDDDDDDDDDERPLRPGPGHAPSAAAPALASSASTLGTAPAGAPEGRRGSVASLAAGKGESPHGIQRKLSVLKRNVSGRVRPDSPEDDDFDDTVDNRVGVYDTSKKQRVPSWCDRVLFKSHIVPDVDPADDVPVPVDRHSFSRLSTVLSNFGGHFRTPIKRANTLELPASASASTSMAATPALSPSVSPTRLDAAAESPALSPPADGEGSVPGPRMWARRSPPRALGPVVDTSPAQRDASVSPTRARRPRAPSSSTPRPGRALSPDHIPAQPQPPRLESLGAVDAWRRAGSPFAAGIGATPRPPSGAAAPGQPGLYNARSGGAGGAAVADERTGALRQFFGKLPAKLNPRVALFHTDEPAPAPAPAGPGALTAAQPTRRHMRGEVEVLHYGTIDDAGMRVLEGRSDHRPAIFAAAVYV
ncbi:hypothetical protein Q5752_002867 [Cryptotrichosporon argae]